jgi:hypothetical protein
MSNFLKNPESFPPSDVKPSDITHAYQTVLHACGARVAIQLLNEFELDAPAGLDPALYVSFLATTRMLVRYAD